jgi:hypothetical protein
VHWLKREERCAITRLYLKEVIERSTPRVTSLVRLLTKKFDLEQIVNHYPAGTHINNLRPEHQWPAGLHRLQLGRRHQMPLGSGTIA